ncbi:MAG: undecaprenyl diphosphate synthase family protein [Caldilineaceae bacterium]
MADGVSPDDLSEDTFSRYLYTGDLPDPDLIIRTGGEYRLSNFLSGRPPIPNTMPRQPTGRISTAMNSTKRL